MALLRSLLFLLLQSVSLMIWGSLFLLAAPFLSPSRRYDLAMVWPGFVVWMAQWVVGIRWELRHEERLTPFLNRSAVVCSKHQSAWETLFLPSHMPRQLCFVFKRELLRVPFFGWAIGLLPMIHIDRRQGRQAYGAITEQAERRVQEGRWITFFPEGTRTRPGQRIAHKTGAARLAYSLGLPIIPMAHNAGLVWPRNALIKRPGLITIEVGQAFDPKDFPSAEALGQAVEDWIETTALALLPPHA